MTDQQVRDFWVHESHKHDGECATVSIDDQWEELTLGTLE